MTEPTIGWFVGQLETQYIITVPLVNNFAMVKERVIEVIFLWSSSPIPEIISPWKGMSGHLSYLHQNLVSSTICKSKQFKTI